MGIMLGNLSVQDIQRRLGIDFPPELIEWLQPRYQSNASDIQPGRWHCFDIPFTILCGDRQTASHIFEQLGPLSEQMACQLQIAHN